VACLQGIIFQQQKKNTLKKTEKEKKMKEKFLNCSLILTGHVSVVVSPYQS